jgi:predicted aspartyl protease
MSVKFNPRQGLVVLRARIEGPTGKALLRLALDTGATATTLSAAPLVAVGYDPATASERVEFTTGSGVEFAARITLLKIRALAREEVRFPVLCHTLPPSAGVDGVLGLDFLRGRVLTIDFQNGTATLQ